MDPVFEFEDLRFEDSGEFIVVHFLKIYVFEILKADLEEIGDFKISENCVIFKDIPKKKAEREFYKLLSKGFDKMKNSLNGHSTVYIHSGSGIPLIGNRSFGIVDRGSNMIEIKPNTSCNVNCVYCSVDEGISTKKVTDYVVEKDYLVEETEKLVKFKKSGGSVELDIYINPQGEPLLYADLFSLVKDLKEIDEIKEVHVITNGVLLTKELIDKLAESGLTHLNISLCSLDEKNAKILSGYGKFDVKNIAGMIDYAKDKFEVIITPVYVPGMNDSDLKDVVLFGKERNLKVMIQNFLENKRGRVPVKQKSWNGFYQFLEDLEKETGTKLRPEEIKIVKTQELPQPFKKGDVIKADIVAPGRYGEESLAVSNERSFFVLGQKFSGPCKMKVKIVTAKNNLFSAVGC